MTVMKFNRTRTRIIPNISGSNVILGKFYPGILSGGIPTGAYSLTPNQTLVYNYLANSRFQRAQLCMDTIHEGPPYRTGDDFQALSYDWSTPYSGVHGYGVYDRADKLARYTGGFNPPDQFSPQGVIDEFSFGNQSNLTMLRTTANPNLPGTDGLGDKAWDRTKPKLQKSSAGVFGAELRDMPRMLESTSYRFHQIWRTMRGHDTNVRAAVSKTGLIGIMRPKKVADDFINQQFGWAPFIGDLVSFQNTIDQYHEIIAKLIARNDRWVRRRVPLRAETIGRVVDTGIGNKCCPVVLDPSYFVSQPTWTIYERQTFETTAVGKFRYYRPEFDVRVQDKLSQWNQAMQFITVMGLRVNPSNVYKAIPWTWLIDWFSNVGDYIDHLNDIWIDQIACLYCFAMQHVRTEREFIQYLPFHSGARLLSFIRVIDSKQRITASSPYGFNLSWDNLTPRQIAILVALGIVRRSPI